jgi:HTH-type transcriptional regulator, competence development regulator
MSEFGSYIKKIRESKHLTLNQVALYSDISAAQLSRIENGKRGVPKPNTIKGISEGLKYDYNKLMEIAGYIKDGPQNNEDLHSDEDYDSLAEINKLLKRYGIKQSGFFDIEKWKAMGPDGVKQLENYFQFIVDQAEKMEKEEQQED